MAYHNGKMFTTHDNDLDTHGAINCARTRFGGWWYGACIYVNPNGKYGGSSPPYMYWANWKKSGKTRYMKESKIMIRC